MAPAEADVLVALRLSGLGAFLLFALGFAATPLARLTGSHVLRRRRRALGIAAAGAVGLHLSLLPVLFAVRETGGGWTIPGNPLTPAVAPASVWLVGGTAALAVLAMLVTSWPGPARRLGARRWRALHRTGSWLVVLVVALDLGDALLREGRWADAPWAALLLGLVGLRWAARPGRSRTFNKLRFEPSTERA